MTKEQKLQAFIDEITSVVVKHKVVVDKYVTENGLTEYIFKLQFEDVGVKIDKLFTTFYHGPPRSN